MSGYLFCLWRGAAAVIRGQVSTGWRVAHQSASVLVQGAGWPSCGGHTSGPLRGRWALRARARAALGEFAATFGAQRGGFVAAAWGARGGFWVLRRFAPVHPKPAALSRHAVKLHRYAARCTRATPRSLPACRLPPVLHPVRQPLPASRAIVASQGYAPTQNPLQRLRHLRCGSGRNVAGWSVSASGASPSSHAAPDPSAAAAFATYAGFVLRRRHKTAAPRPKSRRDLAERSASASAQRPPAAKRP